MKVIKHPTQEQLKTLLQRPEGDNPTIEKAVLEILSDVKKNGDAAIRNYTLMFDKADVENPRVSIQEIVDEAMRVDKALAQAIGKAFMNIFKFHESQKTAIKKLETTPGVVCWRENRAIQNVGIYIPGGSAPLFSTALMLGIPAAIAGCPRIVLCTPPDKNGKIHPAILAVAAACKVTEVYKIGGAQAIAAMAYGTDTIAPVDKIFGPGNRYVTLAKQLIQKDGVAIDMPAGPSEVLVVGDESAEASFIAADLLSQAEHGPDSQVIFLALNEKLVGKVQDEVKNQLDLLPRKNVASESLKHSKIILVKDKEQAVDIINEYAPEHLILAVRNEEYFLKNVFNAGSVFIGNYTPESAGDYASGTNHTLPTNGYARAYSGVSLDSFVKKITYQKISEQGIKELGSVIETMAEAEGLQAHKNAVSIRLKKIKK